MSDEVEIKILNEDPAEERPFRPEVGDEEGLGQRAKSAAGKAGKAAGSAVAGVARKAWQSEGRKKVTGAAGRGVKKAAAKGGQVVQEAVVERAARAAEEEARQQVTAVRQRARETDWKQAAQSGAVRSLRWLSHKLDKLAGRFTPQEKSPPDENPEG